MTAQPQTHEIPVWMPGPRCQKSLADWKAHGKTGLIHCAEGPVSSREQRQWWGLRGGKCQREKGKAAYKSSDCSFEDNNTNGLKEWSRPHRNFCLPLSLLHQWSSCSVVPTAQPQAENDSDSQHLAIIKSYRKWNSYRQRCLKWYLTPPPTIERASVQLSGSLGRGVSDARFDFHLATDSTCPLPGVF